MKEEERTLFRRRHISLVLQEGALLPGLTVEENILLPMAMDTGRLVEEERLEQILEALGLTRLRRRFPARLSGGERQRVVLGLLLSDAEIILADEPCARLGPEAVSGDHGTSEGVRRHLEPDGADGNSRSGSGPDL